MSGTQKEDVSNLKNKLIGMAAKGFDLKAIIGLDGFVDEIIHVVDKRQDFNNYERIETIAAFGDKISKAAGLSMNFEFVPKQVKLGGNGPIFANALLCYGVGMTYVGALGKPDIHPVFKDMASKSTVYSLCDPAHTDALEFNDGKLMLGKLEVLNEITWNSFKDAFGGVEKLAALVSNCTLFGMENWTMLPNMSEIWEGLINEVFPLMTASEKPIAFFDLADPEKRTKEDLLRALSLIGKFSEKFYAVLGLNEKETWEVAEVLGVVTDAIGAAKLEQVTRGIFEKLGIDCLVVHPTREAVCCTKDGFFHANGPYCEKPKLTTGAGDNFNAGFCFALSLGLDARSALILGVSTSGYYVRNAHSPSVDDVIGFLGKWESGEEL